VENAALENAGQKCRTGKRGTGKCGNKNIKQSYVDVLIRNAALSLRARVSEQNVNM